MVLFLCFKVLNKGNIVGRRRNRRKKKQRKQARSSRLYDGKNKRLELIIKAGCICSVSTCQWSLSCSLEFHHKDPSTKRFNLDSWTLGAIADQRLIEEEFNKCVLLCSNHHKMHHAGLLVIK